MPEKPGIKLTTRSKEEIEFWMSKNRGKVFSLLVGGMPLQKITEELNLKAHPLQDLVTHPYFLSRLEHYLSRIFFSFQVNKILSMEQILKLYWDVIMGKQEIKGLTKDQASKHYIKILALKGQDPKVINPKQYNLIMNIFKTGTPEKLADLAKEFGFEDHKVPANEGPKIHPQLDQEKSDQDEQRKED